MSSELVERLKHAHQHSQQRVLGSHIFGEAAARIEALEAALEPFAAFADFDATGTAYEGKGDDTAIIFDHKTGRQVTIGDFRAARRAREGGRDAQ